MSMFGVHVPELQLGEQQLRIALRRAGLCPGETYIELGSGHGLGLVMAASEFGAHAIGVEYMQPAIDLTLRRARKAGVRVDVVRDDLMRFDPSPADVVLLHLGPAFHDVLAPRLERLLGGHTRVVAWGWQVPGWAPLTDLPDVPGAAEAPCWVYQPGEPRLHGSFAGAAAARGLPLGSAAVEALEYTAAVDLTGLEARVEGAVAEFVTATAGSNRIGRGQRTLIELEWTASAPGMHAGTLAIWGHSASGRITQRGLPHPLALRVDEPPA